MNEQTLQMLQALAEKLNTTAENLWAVLIAQARIEGILSSIWVVVCLVLMVASIKTARWIYKGVWHDDWDEIAILPLVAVSLFGTVMIFPMVINLNWAITCFANPEYYALIHILRAVR